MKRYSTNAVQTRWDGKKVFKSTIYPSIKKSNNDILITASEGDYLDTLAQKYYKDPTLWWVIANANNIGKGRLSVLPGTQIRIPSDVISIINEFKRLNKN